MKWYIWDVCIVETELGRFESGIAVCNRVTSALAALAKREYGLTYKTRVLQI